jgi:hypothetical protein
MYLVADKALAQPSDAGIQSFAAWENFPNSYLSHHGAPCCDNARAWFRAMDFAQLNGSPRTSGPRWIRKKYEWGPSPWPLHWCQALDAKSIDCGAHAALAAEAFQARGVPAARAQFVQRYDASAVSQWRKRWDEEAVSDHWLAKDFIYHEGNAVLTGNDMKLWDGSAGSWLNPRHTSGYGGLIAVRIAIPENEDEPRMLNWGGHSIRTGQWQSLPRTLD